MKPLSNIDIKRTPSSLTELCQALGVEYNGRPQACIAPSLYVGMYDDTFNTYFEGEKIETCNKKTVVLKLKDILKQTTKGVKK